MSRKWFLTLALAIMAFAFWYNPNVKEIAAGIAILLFGMIGLENGFRTFAEGPLKKLLKKATNTFYKSMGLGIVSTALLQSSSLISVVTISFVSAGLIDLLGGIGIIFGANIGTTTTAWLVAVFGLKVRVSALAMPLLVFGIVLFLQKKPTYQGFGNILAGLGFFFLGIFFMKQGFDTYKGALSLDQFSLSGPVELFAFVGMGLVATAILQSSSATMAIILTALAASQITYFNALALTIGANVGTTVTALISSLAANAAGKRVAGAHLIFKIVAALIAIIFLSQLKWTVDEFTGFMGIAASDHTLKLATFHTIFNVLGVLIMFPFLKPLATFLTKSIKENENKDIDEPKYLNKVALMYPQSAIAALVKETQHLFDNTFEVISHSLQLHRSDILSDQSLKSVLHQPGYDTVIDIDEIYFNKIKSIYSKIIEFATFAQQSELCSEDVAKIYNIKEANRRFIEVIKDLKDLQPNLLKYLVSENEYIRREYDQFRRRIVKIIRQVFKTQSFELLDLEKIEETLGKHIETRGAKLERLELQIKEYDVLFNGTLDQLIRNKAISSEMASSLNNDSATVANISKNLIKAAELLYIQTDLLIVNLPDELEEMESNKGVWVEPVERS